jgi:hypothetical protein
LVSHAEGRAQRVFENRVLRRIFGFKREVAQQEAGENYIMNSFIICHSLNSIKVIK